MFRIAYTDSHNDTGYVLTDDVFEWLAALEDIGMTIVEVL